MKDNTTISRLFLVIAIMVVFAFLRIFINMPNISPVAAIALFGGTLINRKGLAILFPLAILCASDAVLGFYSPFLMAFVYGSFALIAVLGFWLRNHMKIHNVVLGSLVSSILFFVVSNFGVWAEGLWYPMNVTGLTECFAMAIPFFRYELVGTLGFTMVFFGIYQFATTRISAFKAA
ncbi:MAG TPA: hypothetical protein PLA88_05025 [Bacteroidales bacterium]|nr:hypothetical protein [Bacteroidales bacterium]